MNRIESFSSRFHDNFKLSSNFSPLTIRCKDNFTLAYSPSDACFIIELHCNVQCMTMIDRNKTGTHGQDIKIVKVYRSY